MASEWTPPPSGSPCWINIFATDVQRARTFYEKVFDWKFHDSRRESHDQSYDPSNLATFTTPDTSAPGGGITKVSGSEFVKSAGKGGVALYLYVDNIKVYAEKITAAGGRQLSEIVPEGNRAIMQHFEDTEGNFFGIYSLNKDV